MIRQFTLTALIVLTAVMSSACRTESPMQAAAGSGWSHYGFADRDQGPKVPRSALAGGESNVVVEAEIVDVCPKKGCWMRVVDGGDELFVRFQDYSFFVPMNAAGRRVVMHGTSVATVASVEELRHYAEDAGKSAAEIAAISEPQTRVTFFADSVYIDGDGLDAPFGG